MSRPSQQPSLAIVCADDGPSGDEIAAQLLDLLEHGWDAHLLCGVNGSARLAELGVLPADVLRERVHPPPHPQQRLAPRRRLVAGAVGTAARRPRAALRGLRNSPDPFVRYGQAVLLALNPAIVHFPSPSAAGRYAGVIPALCGRVVVSAPVDEMEVTQPVDIVLARADAVQVDNEDAAALLRSRGIDGVIAVIPPGIDEALLRIGPRPDRNGKAFRILSVAPLTYAEGYEYALQAVALLAERGIACRYRIIGRGELADAVTFARHQLGLERLVEIFDPGGPGMLVAHLTWADAFLSAAVATRAPATILDVQAAALPIVSTEPGCTDRALVAPSRDPDALAERLALLATDPRLRRELANRGRREVRSMITKHERLALVRALYHRVLSS